VLSSHRVRIEQALPISYTHQILFDQRKALHLMRGNQVWLPESHRAIDQVEPNMWPGDRCGDCRGVGGAQEDSQHKYPWCKGHVHGLCSEISKSDM
jgi:hypothetical protein